MRWLARLLGLFVLLALILTTGYFFSTEDSPRRATAASLNSHATTQSIGYRLSNQAWTRFTLINHHAELKILSNARLHAAAEPGRDYHYRIDYRLTDQRDQLISAGEYHHNAQFNSYLTEDGDEIGLYQSSDGSTDILDTRVLLLNPAEYQGIYRLALKASFAEDELDSVLVRPFQRSPLSPEEADTAWPRLSTEQKHDAAKASIYPLGMLSRQEKRRLLRNKWLRLSPLGQEGQDYASMRLSYRDKQGLQANQFMPPFGSRIITPDKPFTFRLPADGGRLKIQLQNLKTPAGAGQIHWYGRPASLQSHHNIQAADGQLELSQFFAGGIISIEWDSFASLRIFLVEDEQALEITPAPEVILGQQLLAGDELSFALTSYAAHSIALRLDAWSAQAGNHELEFHALDSQGQPLLSGSTAMQAEPAYFDTLVTGLINTPLIRYRSMVLNLPAATRELRLAGSGEVIIRLQTRARLAPSHVQVPTPQELAEPRQWYPIRPNRDASPLGSGEAQYIQTQTPIPQVSEEILAGDFDWQALDPSSAWSAYDFLIPVRGERVYRPESLNANYRELSGPSPWVLQRIDPATAGATLPAASQMIYLQSAPAGAIQFTASTQRVHRQPLKQASGSIDLNTLDPVPGGSWQISSNARLFVNNSPQPSHVKRRLLKLGRQPLRFDITKDANASNLSLFVVQALDQAQAAQLSVTVHLTQQRAYGWLTDWSAERYQFKISPELEQQSFRLGDQQLGRYSAGRTVLIPLGADLAAGHYQITIENISQFNLYIALSSTSAGKSSYVEYSHE